MKKLNIYGAAFVLGTSIALLLSILSRAVPVATAGVLPVGGDDFTQVAIVTLALLAIAAIWDIFRRK